eukprot:TRINITY_DN1224_c0_g1_i10.p2 TRINITY_DN1224_c0_g1~~TRINITY_DN1224_c0_g1_i10.p2  ORF type:complete len:167 (+),score=27.61 TRINITY_DN1224_c0_g1_i10:1603-2103(+)
MLREIKDKNPQLERWSIQLAEYDYKIEYRAGKNNVVADGLSRKLKIEVIKITYKPSHFSVSKEGYNNIVVITDYYSKYSVAIPSRSKEAEEVVNIFFRNWCMIFGVPAAVWEYNNSKHEGTRAAPYLMMFMRKPRWEEGYVIEGRAPEENAYTVCKVVHRERYLFG